MKILIAEDEPTLRQNLQWILEMEGYEVVAAVDGREALEHATRSVPDLVITDVMMPNLDGYGLVTALRLKPETATVPIIMLSARADRVDVRAGMNLGADDYLTKPYRREELLETLQSRLARSALLKQTAQLLQSESAVAGQFDPLTHLASREYFEQQLEQTLAHCADTAGVSLLPDANVSVAVLCLGIDGFSKVNQSLGKAAGDVVLQEAARRLKQGPAGARASVISAKTNINQAALGRLGGDVFAVCLAGAFDTAELQAEAAAITALMAKPFEVEGQSLFLTACVGASLAHQAVQQSQLQAQHQPEQQSAEHSAQPPAQSAGALLTNAESALYLAKPLGPGSYQLFDPTQSQREMRKLQIHNDLHRAVERGELQVFYQPQINIKSGALVGFEALLRWKHPSLGWVSPGEFIPIAEKSGTIVPIGEWVMRTAAAQAAQWTAMGHTGFRVAVNLSVRQFAVTRLPDVVQQVLQDTGLAPAALELEVTESLALQSVEATLSTLHRCKALGVKLAMDDFGTGYSSLAYLKRYPLDSLKIDQSFVRNIIQDAGDAAITRAIVAMAQSFGMSVIAEGVETREQLGFLRALGCDEFQGYLCSRPVPAEEAVHCFKGYVG